jgi:hypothetical protein
MSGPALFDYIDYEYEGWVLRYCITASSYSTHLHKKCDSVCWTYEVRPHSVWQQKCCDCHAKMSKEVSLHLEQVYNLLEKT